MTIDNPGSTDASTEDEGPDEDRTETATVPEHLNGARLDVVAARLFTDYSRGRLQAWIEDGSLTINGQRAERTRQSANAGDLLSLRATALPDLRHIVPQELPLDVRYADNDLLILHKPAGLTVHPGAGQPDGTLQNALLYHYPQSGGVPRCGIVHRLDKDTSGLLVVALNLPAHTHLVSALARREIRREYDALVQGALVSGGTVDAPIGRHPRERLKMAVTESGRTAVTHYRVQERFSQHTLLRVRLQTGRTHQIRVHMAHLRHAIVGDPLYGAPQRSAGLSPELRTALVRFPRQALHARELELQHPVSGESLCVTAEPPQDMQDLLLRLRTETGL